MLRTREEMARDYVSKTEMREDMNRIITSIEKIDEKLDRISEAAAREYRL